MNFLRCGARRWSCRAGVFAAFLTVHSVASAGAYELSARGLSDARTSVRSRFFSTPTFDVPHAYAEPPSPTGSHEARNFHFRPVRSLFSYRIPTLHRKAIPGSSEVEAQSRHKASLVEMNVFNELGWLAGRGSNEELLEKLKREGFIRSHRVFSTMLQVTCRFKVWGCGMSRTMAICLLSACFQLERR